MTRTTLLATALVALLSAAGASAQTAPNIGYNPNAGTSAAPGTINFGAGPAGNVQTSVVLTPSGGNGTGAAATTTVSCAFRDSQFSPARLTFCSTGLTASLNFEGATTTAQNLSLCCFRLDSGNLSNQVQCSETRGGAAPVTRVWDVSCGAPVDVPPAISAAVGTTINVCPSRTASITVTNSGGAGASALTVSNCAVNPVSSQFTVNPTSLTVPLGATSNNVLNILLPAGAPVPVNATLTCNTNASNAPAGTVSWQLLADTSCNTTPPPPPPPTGPLPTPVAVPAGGQLGYLTLLALLLGTGVAVVTLRKR